MSNVRIVILRPTATPEVKLVEGNLETYRNIIEGALERVVLSGTAYDPGVDLVCNDEFLCNGSEPNFEHPLLEPVFHGTVFFVRHDAEGEWISLTDDDMKFVQKFLNETTRYFPVAG